MQSHRRCARTGLAARRALRNSTANRSGEMLSKKLGKAFTNPVRDGIAQVVGDSVMDGFRNLVGIESSTQGNLLAERAPHRFTQPLTLRALEPLLDQRTEALAHFLIDPLAKILSDPLTQPIRHGPAHATPPHSFSPTPPTTDPKPLRPA